MVGANRQEMAGTRPAMRGCETLTKLYAVYGLI